MKKKQKMLKNVSDLKLAEAKHHIARLYLYISIISIAAIVIFKMAVTTSMQLNSMSSIVLMLLFCLLAIGSLITSFALTLNIKK